MAEQSQLDVSRGDPLRLQIPAPRRLNTFDISEAAASALEVSIGAVAIGVGLLPNLDSLEAAWLG